VETKKENQTCRAFIAVFAGEIRMIDNIRLK
jgi:pantothenate synthetase